MIWPFKKEGKATLRVLIKPTVDVSAHELEAMWRLYAPDHNTSAAEFRERNRESMDEVALFFREPGAVLVGFTGLRRRVFELSRGPVGTMYLGQTYIIPELRGNALIQRTVIRSMMLSQLRTPLRPLYFWSDCISYKPYLLAARSLKVFYPSPDWDTPPHIRELITILGETYYAGMFSPETGTVQKPMNRLRGHVATITPEDLQDRHIRYYATLNPGHANGDGLIAIFPGTWENVAFFVRRQAARALRPFVSQAHGKQERPA